MSKFGRCLGYTGKPCSNCGRYRVEHFEEKRVAPNEPNFGDGYDICEKCSWCEQLARYITDDCDCSLCYYKDVCSGYEGEEDEE